MSTEYFFLMSYEYSPFILEIKQIIWKQIFTEFCPQIRQNVSLDHVNSTSVSSLISLIHVCSF